jgi:hypothetical protein
MLSKEAQRALVNWEPVSSRIITATFTTKKKKIKFHVVQGYAPTNDAKEEEKEDFYRQLQTVISKLNSTDFTILMGDFNAKIGADNTGYEEVMGTQGLGQMNENGEMFADLCALNSLVIGGSVFPHKRIHKATWRSPDHVTENQIDHVCISQKFRRSLEDVRVKRGADVASDHHLVLATVKLRLKRHTQPASTRTRYNVDFLRDKGTQEQFRVAISNRFQVLQDLFEDPDADSETTWQHAKRLWVDTCEETLGKKTTQHKDWMTGVTLKKIEERKSKKAVLNNSRTRAAKAEAHREYMCAHKEVKKSIKADKREYVDSLARQAEEAAAQRNLKDLYSITKKLSGKFQQTDRPVRDKQQMTTTDD